MAPVRPFWDQIDEMLRDLQSSDDPRFQRLWNYQPFPKLVDWWRDTKKVNAIIGANRCLGGETLIYDPVSRTRRPVSEITDFFHVLSWNGHRLVEAEAFPPYKKNTGPMFRVWLRNLTHFVCSDTHELMKPDGSFAELASLKAGDLLLRPYEGSIAIHEIEYLREDVTWDFLVPQYGNYYAEECIHHNSGKTVTGVVKDVMIFTGIVPPSLRLLYPFPPVTHRSRHVRIIVQSYSDHWPETIRRLLVNDDYGFLPRQWSENYDPEQHIFYGPEGSMLKIFAVNPREQTDPITLRGPEPDHTHIDELTTRMCFTESQVRAAAVKDTTGTVDLTFCAQNGYDWTHGDIYGAGYNLKTDERLPPEKRSPDINVIRVSMKDNPHITSEEIAAQIRLLKPWERAYRVDGLYSDRASGDAFFDVSYLETKERDCTDGEAYTLVEDDIDIDKGTFTAHLERAQGFGDPDQDDGIIVWHIWQMPVHGRIYVFAMDNAEGRPRSSHNVGDIWDVTDYPWIFQCAQLRKKYIRAGTCAVQGMCMATLYGNILAMWEVNNTCGGTATGQVRNYVNTYRRSRLAREIVDETDTLGWYTDKFNKPAALDEAYAIVSQWQASKNNFCGVRSHATLSEMMSYEEKIEQDEKTALSKRVFSPTGGAHADTVTALFQVCYVAAKQRNLLTPSRIDANKPKKTEPMTAFEKEAARMGRAKQGSRFPYMKKQPSFRELTRQRRARHAAKREAGRSSSRTRSTH